jgi:hypothetical protein
VPFADETGAIAGVGEEVGDTALARIDFNPVRTMRCAKGSGRFADPSERRA